MRTRRRSLFVALLLPLLAGACAEELATESAAPSSAVDSEEATGPRRLTRLQIENALDQLGFDEEGTSVVLPTERLVHGFPNNVAFQEPTSSYLAAWFEHVLSLRLQRPIREVLTRAQLLELARRVYRRPLNEADARLLGGRFEAAIPTGGDDLVTLSLLLDPAFLYLIERGDGSGRLLPHELAARLALLLWNGIPDDQLLDAAAAGRLGSEEGISAEIERMLGDDLAERGIAGFFEYWLPVWQIDTLFVDALAVEEQAWPELRADLRLQIERFVERSEWRRDGFLTRLLTGTEAPLVGTLRDHYGSSRRSEGRGAERSGSREGEREREDEGDEESDDDGDGDREGGSDGTDSRDGAFTLPGVMAALSTGTSPSPIRRGVFVLENLLCEPPSSPPAGVVASGRAIELAEGATNRQRVEASTSPMQCAGCHARMNAIGFAFEHYDEAGRFRTRDGDQPVDASGVLEGTDVDGPFEDAASLMARLAESDMVRECFARRWLEYALGRELGDADRASLREVQRVSVESDGNVAAVLRAIAQSESFRRLTEVEP